MKRLLLALALLISAPVHAALGHDAVLYPSAKFSTLTSTGAMCVSCKLYTYEAGGVTPLATYTDSTGGTANANPVVLDARGEGNVWFDPEKTYKLVLKTAADVTVWTVDNVGLNVSSLNFLQAGTGAISRTGQAKMRDTLNAKDFGVVCDGVTDDTANLRKARVYATSLGRTLELPEGTCLLNGEAASDSKENGLLIPYTGSSTALTTRTSIRGQGRSTILKAGTAGMYVVRWSDSWGMLENLSIDCNSLSDTTGLGVVPESTTQTTTLVYQMFNHFRNIEVRNCVEGVEMMSGPEVGAVDSGAWYNKFYDLNLRANTRSIWMRDCSNASCSAVAGNAFIGGRAGQGSNTGVQIDSGVTNNFYDFHFEGIETGTSPNATPTAIKIASSGTFSGSNTSNRFIGSRFEGATRHIENANTETEFIGSGYDGAKVLFTQIPRLSIGGLQASTTPQIGMGLLYQTGSQIAGYENATNVLSGNSFARASQKRTITAGAKVGATAGWVVNAAADDGRMATVPAGQSASTLVVPLSFLKVGDYITSFHLVGQIESGGNTVTVDAVLRKMTAAAADITDVIVATMTQLSVTTDTIMSASNTNKTVTPEQIGADETFYLIITATTAAATDIALQGVAIVVTEF